jgi:tRNA A-37 threonylcarbamoyl transferase component Bud32
MSGTQARFGAYLLTDCIGQGGMAVVYRAKREGWSGFEKTVVVKAMLPALAATREHVERFIAEAKIQAQLSHPGIVQVHDFGVFQGTPYLVMEHLNGANLSQLLNALHTNRRRMPVSVALVIATQICHALGYAHAFRDNSGTRRQIIHSDVSPSNVMVCRDGSVKLLDFGVAKVIDAHDYDTSATVQGKFPYMAPEQVNRLPVDRRVDVFAAGIVLHELLSGRRLFAAATEIETLRRVERCEVAPPSVYNPDVSLGLDAVVLRALSRDPADRFDSGDDMAAALMQVERVGSGRQRVAEFLASVFPATFATVCDVCGKQAVPGFACAECGHVLPPEESSTENVKLADILSEEDLQPEIIVGPPALPGVAALTTNMAEPYPLQTIVDPRRPPTLKRALAIVGAAGVITGVAVARMRAPSFLRNTPTPVSRSVPRRDDTQPICVPARLPSTYVTQPLPVQPPTPTAPITVLAGPALPELPPKTIAAPLDDEGPTRPLPVKPKLGRLKLKKQAAPTVARHAAQPQHVAEAAKKPAAEAPKKPVENRRVREGALLDPFGKED